MLKYSLGLRNALMVTDSLRNLLDGCVIRIYSGAVPASPNDSIGAATLLVEIDAAGVGGTWEAVATDGTLTKSTSETWSGVNVDTGTASFFRLCLPADMDDADSDAYRVQGTVAVAGGDLNLTNTALTSGATQTLDYVYLAMPEQ